jgi:hypothetical protein
MANLNSPSVLLEERAIKALNSNASTIYIFAQAIKRVLIHEKRHFDGDIHELLANKAGVTKGCGCDYCTALYNYRAAKLDLHRKKRSFEKLYDVLNAVDIEEFERVIAYLGNQAKEKRAIKNKFKKELCL